jgi:hypothetical protein
MGDGVRARSSAGAVVLKSLYELVGEPSYARMIERSELNGTPLSVGTISNLLSGRVSSRPRTVRAFVSACMDLKRANVAWPDGQRTLQEWLDVYNRACGADQTDPPRPDVQSRPVRVGIPPVSAEALQPRAELVARVTRAMLDGRTPVLTHPVRVLSGLGGVGKSQLAAHYAGQEWRDPATDVIVWATATSTRGIVEAYAEAASRLFGGSADAEQAAVDFLRWAASTSKRWLIVLDDLQVPGDLARWRPPTTATGRTLITTRYRGAALDRGDFEVIPVDVFSAEESRVYLRERLERHPHLKSGTAPGAELDDLAEDLGHLPLALAQAAAYMINELTPVARYRTMVMDQRRLLDELVPDRDELPDGHPNTVAATWSLSIQRANVTSPAGVAWPLLQVAALLDPAGIPEAVFAAEAVSNYVNHHTRLDRPLGADIVRRGLAVLHRYNLITVDPAHPEHGITVHNLVQRATRDAAAPGARASARDDSSPLPESLCRDDLAYAVADALCDVWPQVDTASDIGIALRANAAILAIHGGDALWDPVAHPLFARVGHSLSDAGHLSAARAHVLEVRDEAIARRGPDHTDVFNARSDLAYLRAQAGDPEGAAAEFGVLLEELRHRPEAHIGHVLDVRVHLAQLQAQAGDLVGAVAEFEALVDEHVRVWGPENSRTSTVRYSLAMLQADTGDFAHAIPELEKQLAEGLAVLGPTHHQVLTRRNNLARVRGEAGDAAGAVSEFERLLSAMVPVMGPHHPNTFLTRVNLGAMRGLAGDPAGAVAELETLLNEQLSVLGPDHPDVLTTRSNLAEWRSVSRDVDQNVIEFENLLAEHSRVMGPDHPRTLAAGTHLANWLQEAGNHAEAVLERTNVLNGLLRALGPEHPTTLNARGQLVSTRHAAGETLDVAELAELAELMARVKGPEHPDTLAIRNNLVASRREAGERVDKEEFEDLLRLMVRVLGPDDPNTLTTRVNLAERQGELGDAVGAVTEFTRVLAGRMRVYGADDVRTQRIRARLAHWSAVSRDTADAKTEPDDVTATNERKNGPAD